MIDEWVNILSQYSAIEWIGLITGIIYVILSAQNKISCWYFGIISCACIAYHDFFGDLKLYSDGVLQSFYVIMGFIGIYQWRKKPLTSEASNRQILVRKHTMLILMGIFISILWAFVVRNWTDSAFPIIDAFTTIFSIIATILLVQRVLSAWIYFIFIDVVMMVLYYLRSFELYAFLYLIFTGIAVYGAWNWYRITKVHSITI